ncbi:hypothetical protein FSP39_001274 [Pinctada imbricata]|uniref:UDP-D-xylose:beta-D-glucoside alpha-1,3-D-xylosyltransferase n=1 Tax=Pinctada imbricata TaxID=66713 RepID=A0AA88XXL5_PINIB|nr:hypothetical protein FSP39_001274 [Pinctada imbricata]
MLFFRPIEELWSMFEKFNSSQVVAIPPNDPNKVNWYQTNAKHPFYGSGGLNTGVMLMNLTRLRAIGYTSMIENLYKEWNSKIMWGEQDLHNIWLHYHPENLYLVPCEWNYRDAHCIHGNVCEGAEKNGIHVLHGVCQRLVTPGKSPELFAVNNAFKMVIICL